MVMREVLDGWEGGVHIGGRRITNLRYMYADDNYRTLGRIRKSTTGNC